MHRISHARGNADFTVDLVFEDGRAAKVDLADIVRSAPVAASFRDPVTFVSRIAIAEDGEVLRWDEQFELHADSLRYRAFPDELARDYGPEATGRGRPAAE